jgi:glycine/D-amino acid oxidase-like deaminating enzyme
MRSSYLIPLNNSEARHFMHQHRAAQFSNAKSLDPVTIQNLALYRRRREPSRALWTWLCEVTGASRPWPRSWIIDLLDPREGWADDAA